MRRRTLLQKNGESPYVGNYLTLIPSQRAKFTFPSKFYYSLDSGATWSHNLNNGVYVNSNQKLMLKNTTYTSGSSVGNIRSSKCYEVKGNIMSLIYGDDFADKTSLAGKPYVFSGLFNSGSKSYGVTNIDDLVLPATVLSNNCYRNMFCDNPLTSIPNGFLPAKTLASNCYELMFYNCNITNIPSDLLPVTTLADYCYNSMFSNCTKLTTAPDLPATTLSNCCYQDMFNNCYELTTAPDLPATTLAIGCYGNMFYGCSSLNYVKCLATDISATDCLTNWVYNVAASGGTFVKASSMSGWTTGDSGIPSGWTVQNA